MEQVVRFCTAPDAVRIAYAVDGSGPPVVKVANWLTHLEYDWESPVWRHWLGELTARATVVRYDERCCGLSDPDPRELGIDAFVSDLEAVIDAVGLDRFSLLAISQGGAVAIEYAARHPERVEQLIFCGAYARGRLMRGREYGAEEHAARLELVRIGWGRGDAQFRRVFANWMLPDGTAEEIAAFDELQARTSSAENAVRLLDAWAHVDVTGTIPSVTAPALVCHGRYDQMVAFEEGRLIATSLPDARFVALESRNHLLLEREPAWPRFLHELDAIGLPRIAERSDGELSTRELEVVALAAKGLSNDQIAERLVVSPRTVERHLSNVYVKWRLTGKAARAAAAARYSQLETSSRTT